MESGSKTPNVSTAVPFKHLHELIAYKTSAKFFLYICDRLSCVLLLRITLDMKTKTKIMFEKRIVRVC